MYQVKNYKIAQLMIDIKIFEHYVEAFQSKLHKMQQLQNQTNEDEADIVSLKKSIQLYTDILENLYKNFKSKYQEKNNQDIFIA